MLAQNVTKNITASNGSRVRLACVAVGIALVLMPHGSAAAQFQNKSGNLPGIEHNLGEKIGVIGAVGGAAVITLLYLRHHQRKAMASSPLEMPLALTFSGSDRQKMLIITNRGSEPLNLSDVNIGRGFELSSAVSFPQIVSPGREIDLTILRQASFPKKSRVSVTVIDAKGKALSRQVTIRAAPLGRAR